MFIKQLILVASLALIGAADLFSQDTFFKMYGRDDTLAMDEARSLIHTSDGGFLMAGLTFSYGQGQSDIFLQKTDGSGSTQWFRTYGTEFCDKGKSVVQDLAGDYVLTVTTGFSPSTQNCIAAGESYYNLLKVDGMGDLIWMTALSIYGVESVINTSDSGYVVVGSSLDGVALAKVDVNGNVLWQKSYGDGFGFSVAQTTDGGLVVTGYIDGSPTADLLLFKTDGGGSFLWGKSFGGSNLDEGFVVKETQDSGFIVAGATYSFGAGEADVYLIRTDSIGNLEWARVYGREWVDEAYDVIETFDGNFLLTGTTYFTSSINLIQTNSLGSLNWITRHRVSQTYNQGSSLVSMGDTAFVIAGMSGEWGEQDISLIKTDSIGNSGCEYFSVIYEDSTQTIVDSVVLQASSLNSPTIVPIIAGDYVQIDEAIQCSTCGVTVISSSDIAPSCLESADGMITLSVSGTNPPFSYTWSTGDTAKDISNLPVGTYIVTVTDSTGCQTSYLTALFQQPFLIGLGPDLAICVEDTLVISPGSGFVSYLWSDSSTNESLEVVSSGLYAVSVTNTSGCVAQDSIIINAYGSSTVDIGADSVICDGTTIELIADSGFVSYLWSDGTSNLSIAVDSSDIIFLEVTDSNGCTHSDTVVIDVIVCSYMDETVIGNIELFPCPSTGKIKIRFPTLEATIVHVSVLNLQGRQIMRFNQKLDDSRDLDLNLSSVPDGVYYLLINGSGGHVIKKIIISD